MNIHEVLNRRWKIVAFCRETCVITNRSSNSFSLDENDGDPTDATIFKDIFEEKQHSFDTACVEYDSVLLLAMIRH